MIIKGFWHIYLVNHWYTIVSEQMRILIYSGLYDACEEINIGCIGSNEEFELLNKYFLEVYPKLMISYHSIEPHDYEFRTIQLIEADKSSYAGFYFHTKAVTSPGVTRMNHWRGWLNEHVINRWREHYERVIEEYDVSAVNFLPSPNHYSGNFWWFNSRHVDGLPKLATLDHDFRYFAEQWICMREGKYFYEDFKEPGDNSYKIKENV